MGASRGRDDQGTRSWPLYSSALCPPRRDAAAGVFVPLHERCGDPCGARCPGFLELPASFHLLQPPEALFAVRTGLFKPALRNKLRLPVCSW